MAPSLFAAGTLGACCVAGNFPGAGAFLRCAEMKGSPAMLQKTLAISTVVAAMSIQPAMAQEDGTSWLPSLLTDTPAQGFDLAVTMAREAVTTTQTDTEVLFALRPNYSRDPQSLIDVSGVVARYFAIVAEANDYWRD